MVVVVCIEGFGVATVGIDAAPGAFEYPGAEQVLHKLRYIVAIPFLPADSDPMPSVNLHAGTITVPTLPGKGRMERRLLIAG